MDDFGVFAIYKVAKFKADAREFECDENETHWDAKLKRVSKQKPVPEKPE